MGTLNGQPTGTLYTSREGAFANNNNRWGYQGSPANGSQVYAAGAGQQVMRVIAQSSVPDNTDHTAQRFYDFNTGASGNQGYATGVFYHVEDVAFINPGAVPTGNFAGAIYLGNDGLWSASVVNLRFQKRADGDLDLSSWDGAAAIDFQRPLDDATTNRLALRVDMTNKTYQVARLGIDTTWSPVVSAFRNKTPNANGANLIGLFVKKDNAGTSGGVPVGSGVQWDNLAFTTVDPLLWYGPVTPTGFTVPVSEDAYIRGGAYNRTNYGTEARLTLKQSADGADFQRKVLLQFDISIFSGALDAGLALPVANVDHGMFGTFRVLGIVDNQDGYSRTADGGVAGQPWTDETITWYNAPKNVTGDGSVDGGWDGIGSGVRLLADKVTFPDDIGKTLYIQDARITDYLNWAMGNLGDFYGTGHPLDLDGKITLLLDYETTYSPGGYALRSIEGGEGAYLYGLTGMVPEPATFCILGLGLALAARRRRRTAR